MRHYF